MVDADTHQVIPMAADPKSRDLPIRLSSAPLVLLLAFASAGPAATPGAGEQPPSETAPSDPSPRYRLYSKLLLLDGPNPPSRLEIVHDREVLEVALPPGADVWRDASEQGYLVVSFMDRRFSSFRSTGLDFVDLETGRRVPLVRGMIWHARDALPDVLVGVRRVPREAPVLVPGSDIEYEEAAFELFVLSFDPASPRWTIAPIRTAWWLPDANRPYPPGEPPPVRVRVEGGVLLVARDATGAAWDEIQLSDLVPW